MFLNLENFTKFLGLYHKMQELAVYQSQLDQMT